MGKFHDLLSSVGVGEDGTSVAYPETFMDDIMAAYDEDFSLPAAKIQTLEAELAEAVAEIATLKAHNYDLLMQVPTNTPEPNDEGENEPEGEDSEEDDDPVAAVFRD